MKLLLLSWALLSIVGCSASIHDGRTMADGIIDRVPAITTSDFTTVATVRLNVYRVSGLQLADITYTSSASASVTEDVSALISPTEDVDGLTLDLGSYGLSGIRINQLSVCGAGTEKCTAAQIIAYTVDLGGANAGLGGFVNITENYGGNDVTISGTGGDATLGHTVSNANVLSSYTITGADRKLSADDFTSAGQLVVFPLEVDFSNAGVGDYQMQIEIAVQLAL